MLACSKYFLYCPNPYLIKARDAKVAKSDLVVYFIKSISF